MQRPSGLQAGSDSLPFMLVSRSGLPPAVAHPVQVRIALVVLGVVARHAVDRDLAVRRDRGRADALQLPHRFGRQRGGRGLREREDRPGGDGSRDEAMGSDA